MNIIKDRQFMITSERWQILEKERLEILRKRELIEHRIDLRYHSEEGLEQHRSDYYKRLLKKVEDNIEKSRIRNKQLVKKADELLTSISSSGSNNLVKSKVKLEVAKKQFLQSFQDRVKEYEELGRQEKLKKIRKTEEEIEIERRRLRESTLEWEREKKVNYDLQERIKELIITKEQTKKEAIEREAERKAMLEGERKIQRVVEQTSIDASRRYIEKQEKRKMETVEGKDSLYKGIVEEVYDGKIGIAVREKFISPIDGDIQQAHQPIQKPADELYYNDGYSSVEDKKNANSFAKFKEWQKKQSIEKKKVEQRNNCKQSQQGVNQTQEESSQLTEHKDFLGHNIEEIEDRESESDDITKSFLESIKKPNLISSLVSEGNITKPISVEKTEEQRKERPIATNTSPKQRNDHNPSHISNVISTIPTNSISSNNHTSMVESTELKKVQEKKKENEKDQDQKDNDSKTKKLKSFFSAAFKLSGKKKEEEKQETESSSENDVNPQDKEGDIMVQQKVKKIDENKLVSTLQTYLQDLERHLNDQKEKYNKMSMNFKLENKESQELLIYSNLPKITGKVRVQNLEATKKDLEPNMKSVACLDIVQYFPSPLVTTGVIEDYLIGDSNEYEIDDLSKYLNSTSIDVWRLIITHVINLSKLEPKWKEQLLKIFSDTVCKTLPAKKNNTDAKSQTKTLLKVFVSRKSIVQTQEQPKKNQIPETKEITKSVLLDDSEEENIFDKPLTQVSRPLSSVVANNKFKKTNRLITSVSAFNSSPFAKINKNFLNEDTSDSDIDNIIARPRNISSAPSERTKKPNTTMNGNGTTDVQDFDDDLDF